MRMEEMESVYQKRIEELTREKHMDDDLQAIERVRGVQLELARTEASYESGIHLGQLNDACAELVGAEKKLRILLNNIDVDHWKTVRQIAFDRLQVLDRSRRSIILRDQVNFIRERLLKLIKSKRLAAAEQNADEIEIRSLQIHLRREAAAM